MIKSFKEYWIKEQHNFIGKKISDVSVSKEIYDAGVKAAKGHYEEEAVAIMEYYDTILRKTSAASINDVPKPPQSDREREVIRKLLAGEFA